MDKSQNAPSKALGGGEQDGGRERWTAHTTRVYGYRSTDYEVEYRTNQGVAGSVGVSGGALSGFTQASKGNNGNGISPN